MALPEDVKTTGVSGQSLLTHILKRDLLIVGACLAAICGLAWWWLWRMSGLPDLLSSPSPNEGMADMPMGIGPDIWSPGYLGPTFLMWAIMMVAMMLPSASPMILLHAAFTRRSSAPASGTTFVFALTYLLIWIAFAAFAALAQAYLISLGVMAEARLALGNRVLAATLLLLIAIYQLSGLKQVCLAHCQSPVSFLLRHWRPGYAGAARMGTTHGLYCVGCCGFLMLLLFIGGIMNLGWIAFITFLALVEKYAPQPMHLNWLISGALIAFAILLLLE